MTAGPYGFVGLGNMGQPMAANLAAAGFRPLVYDRAGTAQRAPEASQPCDSAQAIAGQAATVFLSVPDGAASLSVARELASAESRVTTTIIDLSTTGIEASREIEAELTTAGIDYIDSPVSGGVAGARAASLTLIWAGAAERLEQHLPALQSMTGNQFHVGARAGLGQAMKLLNNFLSATALAATSEAMLFGLAQGLELQTMIDVVNVSTGRNTATSDKFPRRVITGTFDAGFHTALMRKDVELYAAGVRDAGTAMNVGETVDELWRQADWAMPGSDITEIFNWLKSKPQVGRPG